MSIVSIPCMICDLYRVIDQHLKNESESWPFKSDFAADLVTVLPPRGHGFHNLSILEGTYQTPVSLEGLDW